MRFRCRRIGSNLRSGHQTFSLLPLALVPFRKLTLFYMVFSVLFRIRDKLSLMKTLDVIVERLCVHSQDILFVHEAALIDYINIMKLAQERFRKSLVLFPTWEMFTKGSGNHQFLQFLEYCKSYSSGGEKSIRGPPGLAWEYYIRNVEHGGFGLFLFGVPSQERERQV